MITVYALACDGGDGSCSIQFFTDAELVDWLVENDEDYYMCEGGESFQVPDLGSIRIQDRSDYDNFIESLQD